MCWTIYQVCFRTLIPTYFIITIPLGVSELVASPAQDLMVAEASLETSLPSTSSSRGRARKRKAEESLPETESVAKVGFMFYLVNIISCFTYGHPVCFNQCSATYTKKSKFLNFVPGQGK